MKSRGVNRWFVGVVGVALSGASRTCIRGGSVRWAGVLTCRFSFLRGGTDAPAPGQLGASGRWVWVTGVARQVHIDQGNAPAGPLTTVPRRGLTVAAGRITARE